MPRPSKAKITLSYFYSLYEINYSCLKYEFLKKLFYYVCTFASWPSPVITFWWVFMTIMCSNDELSSTLSWVCCLLKNSELFILFAINSQILLKNFVISTFSKQSTQLIVQLNSLLRQMIDSHQCPIQIPNTKLLFFGCSSY